MSVNILKSEDRGKTKIAWLDSKHSFSFGEYFNPDQMGYRSLRVINEDRVGPGMGFPTHPHRSMEILSYVVEGQLTHKDDMGNERVIEAGEFQYMSAGDGVRHSEFNPSNSESVHFLQIWIEPKEKGGEPRYKDFQTIGDEGSRLKLLASPDGAEDSAEIRQDAQVYHGKVQKGEGLTLSQDERFSHLWIQVISGEAIIDDRTLLAGDGAGIEADHLKIQTNSEASFLLFRLA